MTARESQVEGDGGARRVIWLLLGVALVVRAVLVWRGGQFFWPDESRYGASQEAVGLAADGNLRAGLALVVGGGDHPGFKLLGMIPALVARVTGVTDPRLPAAFFALLSWLALWLLWGVVRRLGAAPREQAWIMGVAATTSCLAIYCRHLLPYDAALMLVLAAWYVGSSGRAGLGASGLAGLLAGCAVTVYLGYWLLAGVVLFLLGCSHVESFGRRVARWGAAGFGAVVAVAAIWAVDQWGNGTMLANMRRFSGTITQGDFGLGYRLVWEYFWHAEGALLVLWIVATGWLTRHLWRERRGGRSGSRLGWLALAGLGLTYAGLVLPSDVGHIFVVYGRTARELAPFFCVIAGLALARWANGDGRRAWGLAAALAVSFACQLMPLGQLDFPLEFRRRADARLREVAPPVPGRTYDRLVNVEQYLFEPERLNEEPEATLLAARHPYEYAPYLYEGFSARQRAERRAVDHRLRLVRMRVPDTWLVRGEEYGAVRMRVQFASGRAGMSEPLLSLGPKGAGILFFVRYVDGSQLRLGFENVGDRVVLGPLQPYEPGREHTLELFSGALLPEAGGDFSEAARLRFQNTISIRCDGVPVLEEIVRPYPVRPAEVHAGYNHVHSDSAGTSFSGRIVAVERGGLPTVSAESADRGAVRCLVQLPAHAGGVPEPLVTAGVTGRATLAFVRVLPDDKIKVGVEVWGVGAWESDVLAADSRHPVELVFSCPSFLPPTGDPWWASLDDEARARIRGRIRVAVDGRVVLDVEANDVTPPGSALIYGRNPAGGSLVTDRFTGTFLQVSRLAPGRP